MVEKLNPKSTGNIGHFEVVRETGSVLLQSTLWGCFELKLVESYILGAELPKSAEHYTVAIHKQWLACRGAKVSQKQEDLMKKIIRSWHA